MPELRRDPINGRWVIVSNKDPKGPSDFTFEKDPISQKGPCPFCAGNEHLTPPEVHAYRKKGGSNAEGWEVRVIPNKYPALSFDGKPQKQGKGVFDMMNGIGAHEVIIETPDHDKDLSDLDQAHLEKIVESLKDRSLQLRGDKRFRYVMIFRNRGKQAGASLVHPHTQLIALPMVPKNVSEELKGALSYYEYKERCIYCDILEHELGRQKRIVSQNDNYAAICPFTSRFAFETWIVPKKHFAAFDYITPDMVCDLAAMLKDVVGRINKTFDNPPYNFIIHTSPIEERIREEYHWHLEIIPKLTKVAGFEWGSGFYVNPTSPEEAAEWLRRG